MILLYLRGDIYMRKIAYIIGVSGLLFGSLFLGCQAPVDHHGRTPVVSVGDTWLYEDALSAMIPQGMLAEAKSDSDSVAINNRYINHWIDEQVLLQQAERNVPNSKDIDKMVRAYRTSLLMNAYQKALFTQKVDTVCTADQMKAFYEEHSDDYTLSYPIVRGMMLKVPLSAPKLYNVRRWMKTVDSESAENLDKYSLAHAMKFEYFADTWVPLADVISMVPLQTKDPVAYLQKRPQVEVRDTAAIYFLHVTEVQTRGQAMPFDMATSYIKKDMLHARMLQLMDTMRHTLKAKALEEKKIIYYNND